VSTARQYFEMLLAHDLELTHLKKSLSAGMLEHKALVKKKPVMGKWVRMSRTFR